MEAKVATDTTMVSPVLEYASAVWDTHRQDDLKTVEQVQHRAARYGSMANSRTPGSVTSMLKDIGKVYDRRYTARLSLLYKIHYRLVDVGTSCYLRTGNSRTRAQKGCFQERINCEVFYSPSPTYL